MLLLKGKDSMAKFRALLKKKTQTLEIITSKGTQVKIKTKKQTKDLTSKLI